MAQALAATATGRAAAFFNGNHSPVNGIGLAANHAAGSGDALISFRPGDVFRSCYRAYLRTIGDPRATNSGTHWSRNRQNYAADFELCAKRALNPDEWKLFKSRYISGLDWEQCAKLFGLNRAEFHWRAAAIENKLGREFAAIKPYPLYPVSAYFAR